MNATDAQVFNMTRTAPPPPPTHSTAQSSTTMESQHGLGLSIDAQNQMIQKFSQQSGMTIDYSKLLVFVFHRRYIDLLYSVILVVCCKINGTTIKRLRTSKIY